MTPQAAVDPVAVRLQPLDIDRARYRQRVIFESYKWDPQVGDIDTICDHACVLSESTATYLSRMAELLTKETLELENALLDRPDLYRALGIPLKLRGPLARTPSATSVRIMRFDFHPTLQGWALSEVNSDVPGGYAEASMLPKIAAAYVPHSRPNGDVGAAVVAAVRGRLDPGARIAFVHATSYADDRQVMRFLADRFAGVGFKCHLAAPDHLRWRGGRASSVADGAAGDVDGIVRFFPADWLPALPRRAGWRGYFACQTLACNPVRALLSQSKRLPVVWDRVGVALPTWRALLPETRDPREAPWQDDESWIVKPAFGRVGEGLAWRGGVSSKVWRRTRWKVGFAPRQWIAQRRFQSRPLPTRDGSRHLCIGAFTVDGKAAGFYGRLSDLAVIEKHAQDVAVLVDEDTA